MIATRFTSGPASQGARPPGFESQPARARWGGVVLQDYPLSYAGLWGETVTEIEQSPANCLKCHFHKWPLILTRGPSLYCGGASSLPTGWELVRADVPFGDYTPIPPPDWCPLRARQKDTLTLIEEALSIARDALKQSKIDHYYCEDTWYSCPAHPDGCGNDTLGGDTECNCGADKHNARIDQALAKIEHLLRP